MSNVEKATSGVTGRTIHLEVSDKTCRAILTTALESSWGIRYWADVDTVRRDEGGWVTSFRTTSRDGSSRRLREWAESRPAESNESWRTVNARTIRLGLARILAREVSVSSSLLGTLLADLDAAEGQATDVIVQAGLFGEIRYS